MKSIVFIISSMFFLSSCEEIAKSENSNTNLINERALILDIDSTEEIISIQKI